MSRDIDLFRTLIINQFRPFIRDNPALIASVDQSIKIIDEKRPQNLYELLIYLILDTTRRIENLESHLEEDQKRKI